MRTSAWAASLMEQFLMSPAGSGAIAGDRVAWRRHSGIQPHVLPQLASEQPLSVSALGEKVKPLPFP